MRAFTDEENEQIEEQRAEPDIFFTSHDRLVGAVKDLVLALRGWADDLEGAEPTDVQEMDGKLRGLAETVGLGIVSYASAADAYGQEPEEPIR